MDQGKHVDYGFSYPNIYNSKATGSQLPYSGNYSLCIVSLFIPSRGMQVEPTISKYLKVIKFLLQRWEFGTVLRTEVIPLLALLIDVP